MEPEGLLPCSLTLFHDALSPIKRETLRGNFFFIISVKCFPFSRICRSYIEVYEKKKWIYSFMGYNYESKR